MRILNENASQIPFIVMYFIGMVQYSCMTSQLILSLPLQEIFSVRWILCKVIYPLLFFSKIKCSITQCPSQNVIRALFCFVSRIDTINKLSIIFIFTGIFPWTVVLTAATFYFVELVHQLIPITERWIFEDQLCLYSILLWVRSYRLLGIQIPWGKWDNHL